MTDTEKLNLFKETLSIDDDIDFGMELNDMDMWDSMARLSLIVLFKDKFGRKLTFEEVDKFVYVKDVLEAMG